MSKQHVVCIATVLAAATASSTAAAAAAATTTAAAAAPPSLAPTLDLAVKLPRGGEQEQPADNGDVNAPPKQDHNNAKSKRRRKKKTDNNPKKSPKPSSSKPNNTSAANTNNNNTPKQSPTNPVFEQILKENDYYKILGVQRNDSDTAIQKAYRRKAVLTHPDKTNGDRRAFDKVAKAYDVLSDANKRQIYDRYGADGVEQAATGGMPGFGSSATSPEDLFRSFFGAAGSSFFSSSQQHHHHQQPPPSRNRTTRYRLSVTLEDLYQGVSQNIWIRAPADHFYRRTENNSNNKNSRKQVHVQIPRGACDGQCIVMSGEIDFEATDTPADLIFILQQRPHPVFTRKGYDLAMTMRIRLKEAICGVHRTIRHLDGRLLHVVSATHGQKSTTTTTTTTTTQSPIVIRTGDVQRLKGQGMPKNAQGTEFGDLYIQYEVVMPTEKVQTSLSSQEREELGRLLDKLEGISTTSKKGKAGRQKNKTKVNELELSPASLSDFGVASGTPHFPTMEEEHEQDDDAFSQFGDGRFFFSSRRNGLFHPFFGDIPPEAFSGSNADDNVQCRQM